MDARPHKEREKDGLKTRTEVLGKAWIEKSQANVDDFNREFNELLHTYCWNDIWNRPGLSRKTRSMLNLGMLTALGKEHELKLHIRGALNNGVTKDEIKEVFMQAAIYAGVNTSLISSLVTPLFRAPRMWSLSSCSLPSAVSMPRFSTERILRDRPGRFQMSFQ